MGHRARSNGSRHRGPKPQHHAPVSAKRPYRLRKATPKEVADAVVFENGIGNGSAGEYANVVEAAERAYAEGRAAERAALGLAPASPEEAPSEAKELCGELAENGRGRTASCTLAPEHDGHCSWWNMPSKGDEEGSAP